MVENKILRFGKYRNQSIINLINDINYKDWLLSQKWFKIQYKDYHDYIINYKEPIKQITGILLCDDILEMIGDEFKKIKNKPVDKIKFCARCRRCDKLQYSYSINIFNDDSGYTDSCGDCNIKDMKEAENKALKNKQSKRCKCGNYKKAGYVMCYKCNKNNCSIAKAVMARGYDLGYNPY